MIELNFNLNTKEALECSFNFKEWSRLRNVTCSYLTLKNKINLYTNQLEQVLSEASTFRDYTLFY
uniref:Candidate secreted effector n=1 Tax=Meloidogyne incognita TaxID=6306 RepID=A0A914LZ81_MELIC